MSRISIQEKVRFPCGCTFQHPILRLYLFNNHDITNDITISEAHIISCVILYIYRATDGCYNILYCIYVFDIDDTAINEAHIISRVVVYV